jgi:hypothetical protein
LSERVTDVLVVRGDEQVVDTVVGNQGARFSEKGFATLTDRASTNEGLLDRLGARTDVPAEITARLVPMICKALEAKLKAAGADPDLSTLDRLAEESREVLADRLRAATKLARPLELIIDHLGRGLTTLEEVVIGLADVDATPDLAKLLAHRVDLPADTVMRALCTPADQPGVLLARAIGLRIKGYSAIVRMPRRRRRGLEHSPEQALQEFHQITTETAQRALRFLKVRESAGATCAVG